MLGIFKCLPFARLHQLTTGSPRENVINENFIHLVQVQIVISITRLFDVPKHFPYNPLQFSMPFWPVDYCNDKNDYWCKLTTRSYGVMVSTLDSESSDPSSNLGGTYLTFFVRNKRRPYLWHAYFQNQTSKLNKMSDKL